jgi:hypothetical protein
VELDGVAQSHLALTIANSGSAAGTVDFIETTRFTAGVVKGTAIEIITDGGSTGTVAATFVLTIRI